MKKLKIKNLGQIKEADIDFGDLTLFVGPQATGKSILLQSIKLLIDHKKILKNLDEYGYDLSVFSSNSSQFLELYFGEGMNDLWNENTNITIDGNNTLLKDLIDASQDDFEQKKNTQKKRLFFNVNDCLFLIPAQRILTIANGWPRPFSDFENGNPYVVRSFSEQLRSIMQKKNSDTHINIDNNIFPNQENLTDELYGEIDKSIFHGASVKIKVAGMRRQFYLELPGNSLPFMAWSAGQREFMPLLLSFYWLTNIKNKIDEIKKRSNQEEENKALQGFHRVRLNILNQLQWVVIEEPEMGLHPQAILSVILMCLDLIHSGYRLIISTHSPVLLEAVWAIRFLQQENPDIKYLYQLFNLEPSASMTALFENILQNKTFSTYYFDQQNDGVHVKDISTLDPGDLDDAIADWGGLTSFSSRASEVVSNAVQEKL